MLGLVLLATPASAGGWAVVELDEPLAQIPAGEPVRIGFMVLQHGETPFEGAVTRLLATHRETGVEVSATGAEEGEAGHYVIEVIFPAAGEWKWQITPEPFAETLLPPVTALAPGQLAADPDLPAVPEEEVVHPADVVRGGCWSSAPLAYALDDVAPRTSTKPETKDTTAEAPVVKESETVLPVALTELADGLHAVAIRAGDAASDGLVACGEIVGESLDGALIVGLRESDGSGYVGFARLADDGGQTTVTIYLARDLAASDAPAGNPITIDDAGFSPTRLEITAGSTVSWTNAGAIVHTVASEDLAFDDSGILRPGDSFSQTFDEPGVYSYRCGPHAFMTATIVVT
jgi:plastocyanin